MPSTEVAKATSAVPALVSTPALEIDSGDVALPRIKVGQFMSSHVQEQLVKPGSIYAATGSDDPDPITLWDPKAKGENLGVLFHVLSLRKGRSWVDKQNNNELHRWGFNDPDAHPDSWVTYDYGVCVPEVDTDVPYKLMFTRTGASAAKGINTVLKKNEARGPAYLQAFRMTTVERENAKGKFYVPRVTIVEATQAGIEAASNLASMMSGTRAESQATGDEPEI